MEIQSCIYKNWQLTWRSALQKPALRQGILRHYLQNALACLAKAAARPTSLTYFKVDPQTLIELQLTFCGPQKIKTLNRKFRGEDRVTDVLSFPTQRPFAWRQKRYALPVLAWGDVVICLAQAQRQARQHQRTLEQEVLYLFLHSWLHLYGLDHQTPAQTKKMFWQQDQLYARILKARPHR